MHVATKAPRLVWVERIFFVAPHPLPPFWAIEEEVGGVFVLFSSWFFYGMFIYRELLLMARCWRNVSGDDGTLFFF